MNDLVQAVHDYYADRPVNRIYEKVLVEICASHSEGESVNAIAKKLDLNRLVVKQVLKANEQYAAS